MNNEDMLIQGAQEMNINLDEDMVKQFNQYTKMLLEWNNKMNLTNIVEDKDIIVKHYLDSLAAINTGCIRDGHRVADIGTGAGFPGLPVKIVKKNINMLLVDSLNKRINFLKAVIDTLRLNGVETVHSRAEEVGQDPEYRETFDIVLTRAVAKINVLCEYTLPLLKIGGMFLCFKGPRPKEEIEEAENAVKVLGGKLVEVNNYTLPFSDISHSIVIFEKTKQSPTKYPRKAGKPAKNPLM